MFFSVVHKAEMSGKGSGERSSSEGARATELVEYDEITLTKFSTQPTKTDNIHLLENTAYGASKVCMNASRSNACISYCNSLPTVK